VRCLSISNQTFYLTKVYQGHFIVSS